MRRWQTNLAGIVLLAATLPGCATNRPGNPFAKSGKPADTQPGKKPDGGTQPPSVKSPDSTMVADRKSAPGDPSTAPLNAAGAAPAPNASAGGAPRATPGGHDPQTMAYIDSELRDASPEERASMMANLRGLHPDAVRHLLRGRRMAINARQQQLAAASRSGAAGQPVIQPASAEALAAAAAAGPPRSNAADGLGSTSAWTRQTAANRATVDLAAAAMAAQSAGSWPQAPAVAAQGAGSAA